MRRVIVLLAAALAAAACASAPSAATLPPSPAARWLQTIGAASTITTGPDGLRTFTIARWLIGRLPSIGPEIGDGVSGILQGATGAREPIWLRDDDGKRLSVVWPEGFRADFETGVVLLDGRDDVIARGGDRVMLDGTPPSVRGGDYDHPYIARYVNGSPYPYARDAAPVQPVVLATFKPLPSGACPAALLAGVVLEGDPSQPSPVWAQDVAGRAYSVEWPNGYAAVFAPMLVLLDPEGEPVAKAGDVLDLTGGAMGDGYDFFACSIARHRDP